MNYRADIDGLRAIAVIIVIMFHYGLGSFSGGFIGVDVFFVLSGYLIGSIIFSQLQKGRFDFSTFYFRRIRRLFPVYLVVMVSTFLLAYMLMLPQDFKKFGQSLFASTVYISNILFYLKAGYFDSASHLKPLLHTWSLSVEEQFYMVFPLVAWIFSRFSPRNLFALFGVLTLVSFGAAALYIEKDASAVFYLYPFRAWEMFFGTLLAINFVPPLRNQLLNNITAAAGILLILVPNFLYDASTSFPGINALAPCFGTVLIIYSGTHSQGWVHQLLATKVPVFIGNISYSLYLWHWPIYVLYTYILPNEAEASDIWIMAAATFILSVLSWRFVETPFRLGKIKYTDRHSVIFASTAVLSLVFMAGGYYIYKSDGIPQRLEGKTAAFAHASGDLFGDFTYCKEEDNTIFPDVAFCSLGQQPLNGGNFFDGENYTLIWGDSHGGAYKRGYAYALEKFNNQLHDPARNVSTNTLIVWTGGCPPVFDIAKDENTSSKVIDDRCPVRNQAIADLLQRDKHRINAVALVGRWSYYMNGGGVGVDAHNQIRIWRHSAPETEINNQGEFFIDMFSATVKQLKEDNFKVFAIEQPPEFEFYKARKLALALIREGEGFTENLEQFSTQDYASINARQQTMRQAFNTLEDQRLLEPLYTHQYFCSQSQCSLMLDDMPAYYDNNHVSSTGATRISDMFLPMLDYLSANKVPTSNVPPNKVPTH
ncbi:MAG: hypothetical protein COA42_06905 [Alteromonadaceae bacterium]|nr:MAG: hypothetical protein COA42_06905 [Alteromonadaceae bacterium]